MTKFLLVFLLLSSQAMAQGSPGFVVQMCKVGGVADEDIDLNGLNLILDPDGDTSLSSAADDTPILMIGAGGTFQIGDSAGASFIRMGGATSAFPGMERSGTNINIRRADDSAFSSINALNYVSIAGYLGFTSSSEIWQGTADGDLLLTNDGKTDFGLLQLGGTTSSFPAIKRNGTTAQFVLADDSGFANINAAAIISNTSLVRAQTYFHLASIGTRIYGGSIDGSASIRSSATGAANNLNMNAPVTVTFASGGGDASKTATGFRIAQRKILGVSGRVSVTGTTCTSIDIGDGSDVDRYGATIAVADDTVFDIDDATADPEEFLTTAGDVVITANGGNCVDLVVLLTLHYRGYQAATSD